MIFDVHEVPLSEEEIAEATKDAEETLRLWRKRAYYAIGAFFMSCASVVPFSKGQSLHAYAEPFGRLSVYLTLALMIPCGICVGVAINSWLLLRSVRGAKTNN